MVILGDEEILKQLSGFEINTEIFGLGVTFLQVLFSSIYLIIVKSSNTSSETLLIFQIFSGLFYIVPVFLMKENFQMFFSLDLWIYLMLLGYSLTYFIGIICNLYSVQKLGPCIFFI